MALAPEIRKRMFPGFTETAIQTTGATINVLQGGEDPPLLLLHGHPETHVAWHKIAVEFSKNHTVVLPDLRGYGDRATVSFRPSEQWRLGSLVLK